MIFNVAHSPAVPTFSCSVGRWKPPSKPPTLKAASLPAARDRVIDFGKYKGKMLGALPSSYLKWVSGNLRSGDTHHWAHLADQVLQDPVYHDRLEWEFASRVLDANDGSSVPSSASAGNGAVAQLLEISQRFGWDNDDKVGWSRVNFELLGTSKGGRIPRLGFGKEEKEGNRDAGGGVVGGRGRSGGGDGKLEGEDRRRERRERMRRRKAAPAPIEEDRLGVLGKTEGRSVNDRQFGGKGEDRTAGIKGRFPGREGLLKKVLDGKRYL
ncbi:unnamed protein product [Linum tenue]|uniref:Uncharacterized protein n=1 Tax=Linum tenue TaxID=586396 RepID=A0AAV0JND5_9ROSI|nr:unnamed protein product [Linum tenue]